MNSPGHVLSEGARHLPLAHREPRPKTKFMSDPWVTSRWWSTSRTEEIHVDVLITHLWDKLIGQVILSTKELLHEKKHVRYETKPTERV